MNKIINVGLRFCGVLGMGVAFFMMLPLSRLLVFCSITFAWLVFNRVFKFDLSRLAIWMERHILLSGIAVVCLALCANMILINWLDLSFSPTQSWDFKNLWDAAVSTANGETVLTKSWTSQWFYALCAYIGDGKLSIAIAFTLMCHWMTAFIGCIIGRKLAGISAGLIMFLLIAASPPLVVHAFSTSTECMYSLCLMMTVLLFTMTVDAIVADNVYRIIMTVSLFMAGCWLTIWSRGEGVLILISALAVLVVFYIRHGHGKSLCYVCASIMLLIGVGSCIAIRWNKTSGQDATIFCSNDNLWPRLNGANLEHKGRVFLTYKEEIRNKMLTDGLLAEGDISPDVKLFLDKCEGCPPVVAEYIRREIRSRWSSLSFAQCFELIWAKEWCDWNDPYLWSWGDGVVKWALGSLLAQTFPTVIVLGIFLMSLELTKRGIVGDVGLLVLFFILGNFVLLAICEAQPRYGHMLHVMFGLCLCDFIRMKKNEVAGR